MVTNNDNMKMMRQIIVKIFQRNHNAQKIITNSSFVLSLHLMCHVIIFHVIIYATYVLLYFLL
jgi:hypothetical protein